MISAPGELQKGLILFLFPNVYLMVRIENRFNIPGDPRLNDSIMYVSRGWLRDSFQQRGEGELKTPSHHARWGVTHQDESQGLSKGPH